MIQKTYKAICDNCKNGIIDGFSRNDVIEICKIHALIIGKKHFCDSECRDEWKKNKQGGE